MITSAGSAEKKVSVSSGCRSWECSSCKAQTPFVNRLPAVQAVVASTENNERDSRKVAKSGPFFPKFGCVFADKHEELDHPPEGVERFFEAWLRRIFIGYRGPIFQYS